MPGLDEHGGLAARAEPFDRPALAEEHAVEALVRAVLPGPLRTVVMLCLRDPFQDGTADKLEHAGD